jgi:branched-chain amino acid transport system ATP-binding protein
LERIFTLFPRLFERKSQLARTFSGGEQQMLALGRGLMALPRLLMVDEPFLGLAPRVVEQMKSVFQALHAKGSRSCSSNKTSGSRFRWRAAVIF